MQQQQSGPSPSGVGTPPMPRKASAWSVTLMVTSPTGDHGSWAVTGVCVERERKGGGEKKTEGGGEGRGDNKGITRERDERADRAESGGGTRCCKEGRGEEGAATFLSC